MVRSPFSRSLCIGIDPLSTGWIKSRLFFAFLIPMSFWAEVDRLDSIGVGGFGHDFKALEGHESPIVKVFKSFNESRGNGGLVFLLVCVIFPILTYLPMGRMRMMKQMREATSAIAFKLLRNTEKLKEGSQNDEDRSILGLLREFSAYIYPRS